MSSTYLPNAKPIALEELGGSATSPTLKDEILCLHDVLRPRLVRYVASLGVKPCDAEDIVQEAFLALFRHLLAGRPRTNLAGWLFRVSHRMALKRRTSYRTDEHVDSASQQDLFPDSTPSPEEQVILKEQHHRLRRIFQALPELDRLCLQLRSEGLKYREIASVLNISLGSVYNSLERSLSRLR